MATVKRPTRVLLRRSGRVIFRVLRIITIWTDSRRTGTSNAAKGVVTETDRARSGNGLGRVQIDNGHDRRCAARPVGAVAPAVESGRSPDGRAPAQAAAGPARGRLVLSGDRPRADDNRERVRVRLLGALRRRFDGASGRAPAVRRARVQPRQVAHVLDDVRRRPHGTASLGVRGRVRPVLRSGQNRIPPLVRGAGPAQRRGGRARHNQQVPERDANVHV